MTTFHKDYKGRAVILMKTIKNSYGLMMQAATPATIARSSKDGLMLSCKCKQCGSHYSIDRVSKDDVLIMTEDYQQ